MVITFQVKLDPANNVQYEQSQLIEMRESMLSFVDSIYIISGREYVRSGMFVDHELYEG